MREQSIRKRKQSRCLNVCDSKQAYPRGQTSRFNTYNLLRKRKEEKEEEEEKVLLQGKKKSRAQERCSKKEQQSKGLSLVLFDVTLPLRKIDLCD
jgi:hypothetical protein